MTHGNPEGALDVIATCLGDVLGTASIKSNGAILARIRGGGKIRSAKGAGYRATFL